MAFKKGEPRPAAAGRRRGTPNKNFSDVRALLAELNCNPLEGMAQIAADHSNAPELRGKMFSELAKYTAAQMKAVDLRFVDKEGKDRSLLISDVDAIVASGN